MAGAERVRLSVRPCLFQLALYVLSFLEPKDLLQAAQTCRYWRILAEDNLLWREKCREEGELRAPDATLHSSCSNLTLLVQQPCTTHTSNIHKSYSRPMQLIQPRATPSATLHNSYSKLAQLIQQTCTRHPANLCSSCSNLTQLLLVPYGTPAATIINSQQLYATYTPKGISQPPYSTHRQHTRLTATVRYSCS